MRPSAAGSFELRRSTSIEANVGFKSVAVIGAGVMGCGVAFDLASRDFKVVLKDISEEALTLAQSSIARDYKTYKLLRRDLTCSLEDVLGNIRFTLSMQQLREADLIIENIPENFELKRHLYAEMSQTCSPNTVFAVNTSCIPITEIAALTRRPENVIGVHFMNPVPLKPLVELICGLRTSLATLAVVKDFLHSVKKTPVLVKDSPGFAANRVSHLFMNEAAYVIQESIASAEQVDTIFKNGYGHKMGPLETADLIGIDSVVNSLDILYQRLRDEKFACCPLLRKMVADGALGKKSGKGFYVYD